MTLQDFLSASDLRPAAFAERLGVPASTVTRWINGDRRPSLDFILRIRDATEGKVTLDDFPPRESADHPGAAS